MVKQVNLTQGKVALVDDEDYGFVMRWTWSLSAKGYAQEGHYHKQYMHRLLTQCPKGKQVDHINGDKLDNRRDNLRICTHGQNLCNQMPQQRKKTSIYKGVFLVKGAKTWTARIRKDRKNINLGRFQDEREAAIAYNAAAKIHHGEFARLNEV